MIEIFDLLDNNWYIPLIITCLGYLIGSLLFLYKINVKRIMCACIFIFISLMSALVFLLSLIINIIKYIKYS